MERDKVGIALRAAALAAIVGLCFLVPVAIAGEKRETQSVNLPPEGKALVMVWRDQAVPSAHVAVRRGGGYYLPGPHGDLVEDTPPSYWEDIR